MITATTIAVLLFLPPAVQDARPDFSGKWTLDLSKSDFGQMPPPESMVAVMDHKEPNLKITSTQKSAQGEITNTRTMTTDGKENTNTLRTMMGEQPLVSTTKWNGKALVTAYKLAFQDMALEVTETWELSADGQSLTIARDFRSQQGDFSQKSIFTRQ